jgi:hypothetical protein
MPLIFSFNIEGLFQKGVSDYIASPWAVLFWLQNLTQRKDGHLSKNTVTPKPQAPITMKRRIGRTTYLLSVHYSQTSTETASDKISRLIRNEPVGKAANL